MATTYTRCNSCPFRFPANCADEHRTLCKRICGYELNRGDSHLHVAAERGHDDVVAFILTQKFLDVNKVNNLGRGDTALINAARNGREGVARLLLNRRDINVNARGTNGCPALIWAAMNGRDKVVELLLERKEIKVNAEGNGGFTALIAAARSNRERIVKLLLERGDIDIEAGRWDNHVNKPTMAGSDITPLMYAAQKGHERTGWQIHWTKQWLDLIETVSDIINCLNFLPIS